MTVAVHGGGPPGPHRFRCYAMHDMTHGPHPISAHLPHVAAYRARRAGIRLRHCVFVATPALYIQRTANAVFVFAITTMKCHVLLAASINTKQIFFSCRCLSVSLSGFRQILEKSSAQIQTGLKSKNRTKSCLKKITVVAQVRAIIISSNFTLLKVS